MLQTFGVDDNVDLILVFLCVVELRTAFPLHSALTISS